MQSRATFQSLCRYVRKATHKRQIAAVFSLGIDFRFFYSFLNILFCFVLFCFVSSCILLLLLFVVCLYEYCSLARKRNISPNVWIVLFSVDLSRRVWCWYGALILSVSLVSLILCQLTASLFHSTWFEFRPQRRQFDLVFLFCLECHSTSFFLFGQGNLLIQKGYGRHRLMPRDVCHRFYQSIS